MSKLKKMVVAVALVALGAAGLPAAGAEQLEVQKSGADVLLSWTGGAPTFELFRSTDASSVLDPENEILETAEYGALDSPPPGQIFFYKVEGRADCFRPLADALVAEVDPSTNFGSDPELRASFSLAGESYLKFSLGTIPAGSVIDSATLILQQQDLAAAADFEVRAAKPGWLESTITWNNRPGAGSLYASEFQLEGAGARSWDVTALVADWMSGALSNDGLVVLTTEAVEATYYSRENGESEVPRLCVGWHDPIEDALADLDEMSQSPVESRFDESELVTLVAEVPAGLGDPVDDALAFLFDHRAIYGLADPYADLFLDRIRTWESMTAVSFGRRVQGLPVLDETLLVLTDGVSVWGGSSRLKSGRTFRGTVELTPQQAADAAANSLAGQYDVRTFGAPKLYWVPADDTSTQLRLSYWVSLYGINIGVGEDITAALFIDAQTGATVRTVEIDWEIGDRPGERFTVLDAQNTTDDLCFIFEPRPVWFDESGALPAYPGAPADLYGDGQTNSDNIHAVYHYFFDTFGWRGMSGGGEPFRSYVHWDVPDFDNARYTPLCHYISFGDGWTPLDVVAHEFTHGLTAFAVPLYWENQPGAIGEHLGDFFGSQLDNNWTVNEGRADVGSFIRDMQHPPARTDCLGLPDPDHRDQLRSYPCDKGGVHAMNGILNKASYLMTAGDVHRGISTTGIGRTKAGALHFSVMVSHLHPWSNFEMMADEMVREAQRFRALGIAGFTAQDACDVINAYAAVGYGDPDTDCDGFRNLPTDDGDGDGVRDADDSCPNVFQRRRYDLDRDGIGDACDNDLDGDGQINDRDNCPRWSNVDQNDADGDGVGDLCDDDDNDGVIDINDNCAPPVRNPGQDDLDGDGLGDACDEDDDGDGAFDQFDNCPRTPGPQFNSDGDSHGNVCDNCDTIDNEDQADMDRDQIGDVCDNDRDGDGVDNSDDNCPDDANAGQYDNDGDDIGLACDPDEMSFFSGLSGAQELALFLEHLDVTVPIRLPIFPCVDGECPDRLTEGFNTSVQLSGLTLDYAVRIVDDRGFVMVDHGTTGGSPATLSFDVDHEYFYRDGPGAAAFAGRSYFLEMFAPDGSTNGQVLEGFMDVESAP